MTRISRSIFAASLGLVLLAPGCSSMNFDGNVSKSIGSNPSSENSKVSVPTPSDNPGNPPSGNPEPPEEALAPVIVAGGYLTCDHSEEVGTVECYIPKDDGTAAKLPQNVDVSFRFVPNDGSPAIPLDYRREDSSSGTIFLIQVNDLSSGEIGGSMTIDGETGDWIFDMDTLDPDDALETFDLLNVPFAENDQFGDGILSGGDDPCSGSKAEGTPHSTGGLQFTVNGPIKDVFIMMTDICGLQTFATTVTLTGPAPMKAQTKKLEPGFANTVLFHLDLLPGSYQILIDNSASQMIDGSQDDFSIGGIRFTSTLQQTSSISGFLYQP